LEFDRVSLGFLVNGAGQGRWLGSSGAERPQYERPTVDELLKHAFCSLGITYLVLRIGQSATSLLAAIVTRRTSTNSNVVDPDRQ